MPAEISTELKSAILTARPVFVSPGKITHYLKSIWKNVSLTCILVFLKTHHPRIKRLAVHQLSSLTREENQNVKTGQKMAAMGINWTGTTCIYIVSSGVKVNADSFIKLISTKIVRHDL